MEYNIFHPKFIVHGQIKWIVWSVHKVHKIESL
jgi:hypothetical protein